MGEAKQKKAKAVQLWNVWLDRREREALIRIVRGVKAKNEEEMERNMDALDSLKSGHDFKGADGVMTQVEAFDKQKTYDRWLDGYDSDETDAKPVGDEPITMTAADAKAVVSMYKDNVSTLTTETGAKIRRAIKRLKRVDDIDAKEGEVEPVQVAEPEGGNGEVKDEVEAEA